MEIPIGVQRALKADQENARELRKTGSMFVGPQEAKNINGIWQVGQRYYSPEGTQYDDAYLPRQVWEAGDQSMPYEQAASAHNAAVMKLRQQFAERRNRSAWKRNLIKSIGLGIVTGGVGLGLAGAGAAGGAAAGGSGFSTVGGMSMPGAFGPMSTTAALSGGTLGTAAAAGAGIGSTLANNFAAKPAITGALKGGVQGYMSGGDLESALKGAALGGATGGYGSSISSALGGGTLGQTVAGGIQGASGGLASGDFKQAALGAALGGGSSYLDAGGSVPGLGTKAGAPLTGGLQGPTQGSGVIGSLTRGSSVTPQQSFMGNLSGGGMNLSSLLRGGGQMFDAYQTRQSEDDIKDNLLMMQDRNRDLYAPFRQSGMKAQGMLDDRLGQGYQMEEDPGYQFQLDEGMKSMDRMQSARGGLYSGAALKEALGYSQGLADQTYNEGFNRYLAGNEQLAGQADRGFNATGALAGVNTNSGDILANSEVTRNNIRSRLLSQLLGGSMYGGV